MLKDVSLTYDDIFTMLQKIILERDFGEIINFEKLIREKNSLVWGDGKSYSDELELIELSALYIFCVMIKKDEEDIFPFLREYVLKILNNSFFDMQENNIKNKLESEYELENNSIEQRYLYILSTIGFNAFNSDIGLSNSEEIDNITIKKIFQKFFLVEYDKFTSEAIKGLFLLKKYLSNTFITFDPLTELLFDVILKRIIDLIINYDNLKAQREYGKENSSYEKQFIEQSEKFNFV